jgi:hypothetical protein
VLEALASGVQLFTPEKGATPSELPQATMATTAAQTEAMARSRIGEFIEGVS